MSIDHAILSIISTRPCSGYDLKVEFEHEGTTLIWAMSYGSIYNRLQVLVQKGLIETYELNTEGRQKIMYELTGKGWTELSNWLAFPPEYPVVKDELLLKMEAWGQGRPDDVATLIEHLHIRKIHSQRLLDFYTKWPENGISSINGYDMLVIEYARSRLKAELEWVEYAMNRLQNPPLPPVQDPLNLITKQKERRKAALERM